MVVAQEEMNACLKMLEACLEKTDINHKKLEAKMESYPEMTETYQEKLEVKMETSQEKTEGKSEHYKLPCRPKLHIFYTKSLNEQHTSRLMGCVWSLTSNSIK